MNLFRIACLAAAVVVALGSKASAQRIDLSGPEPLLRLPAPMEAALRSFDSRFAPRRFSDYAPWHHRDPCRTPPCPPGWYPITERQALFAAIGDFNGDGVLDVVLDGESDRDAARIALLSDGARFGVERLHDLSRVSDAIRRFRERPRRPDEIELGVEEGVMLRTPGAYRSPFEAEPLVLTTDAFEVYYFEKASAIFYYRNGRWHGFTMSD